MSYDKILKRMEKLKVKPMPVKPIPRLRTGILSMDMNTLGGLPRGRTTVFWGDKSRGKSTTLMLIMRETLKRGGYVCLFDSENSFDMQYAERLGMDLYQHDDQGNPHFVLVSPDVAEQAFDSIRGMIKEDYFDLIGLDSLTKTVPDAVYQADMDKGMVADAPRLNSRFFQALGPDLKKSRAALVVVGQERLNLGAYGSPKTLPGGKALGHEASIEIYMGAADQFGTPEQPLGNEFRYTFKKSKLFPYVTASKREDYFSYRTLIEGDVIEIDYWFEIFQAARRFGLLLNGKGETWTGNTAYFEGEKIAATASDVEKFFHADNQENALLLKIEQAVLAKVAEVLPEEEADAV